MQEADKFALDMTTMAEEDIISIGACQMTCNSTSGLQPLHWPDGTSLHVGLHAMNHGMAAKA